jgi:site-specific recombinase XerD
MPKQQLTAAAYHLKPSEVNKIILATNSFMDRCLIKTLYWAGLRRSEVQNLDIRDIDFNRKRITLTGKGNKTRIVPIISEEFLSDLNQAFVFCYNEGKQLSLMAINKIVAKAGKRAGITNPNPRLKHINPHICKHSIARYLKNK